MKIKLFSLVIFLILPMWLGAQLSLMSYNIRYDNPRDGANRWEHRKEAVAEMLLYYQADLFGIQEGILGQVSFLDSMLTKYSYVGVGRDDGKQKGEFAAIFYNTTAFHALTTQTYWLSETPDSVSVGWDASMERITTYGQFLHLQSKDTFHVFNAHFDHIGKVARLKSAELILKLIGDLGLRSKKIIVMGDFNSTPDGAPIKQFRTLLEDSFEHSEKPAYGPPGTFNGFDPMKMMTDRIDYIFTKNLRVLSHAHLDDRRENNLHRSDHLPVLIQVEQ